MIDFSHDPVVTDSLRQWRGREVFPTDLSSADLQGLSTELRLRSIFSARTTNANYLNDVANVVDDLLGGKINMATGRWHLMKKLKQLGYDPETGFPQDMAADVPPAERGSLRDLSSEQRIDLMLKTNVAQARNYGRVVEGNTDMARYSFPAWELVRLEHRDTPRGERKLHGERVPDPEHGWPRRWELAAESVENEGVHVPFSSGMIALKDSPVWQALGDGVGGFNDSLGHPFPPFAFNSGMDWRAVPRRTCIAFGLITEDGTTGRMRASLAPNDTEVRDVLEGLGDDFKASLLKELEGLGAV